MEKCHLAHYNRLQINESIIIVEEQWRVVILDSESHVKDTWKSTYKLRHQLHNTDGYRKKNIVTPLGLTGEKQMMGRAKGNEADWHLFFFYLPGTATKMFSTTDAVKKLKHMHCTRWECITEAFSQRMEQKKKKSMKRCNASLANSNVMSTASIPVPFTQLLWTPADRILICYDSPPLTRAVSFGSLTSVLCASLSLLTDTFILLLQLEPISLLIYHSTSPQPPLCLIANCFCFNLTFTTLVWLQLHTFNRYRINNEY